MSDSFIQPEPKKLGWKFPRNFWFANTAELFERAAYYGMAIALTLYLTNIIGFNDVQTGWVYAAFASILYLMPTISGIMADKIGFRRALILAFTILTVGYLLLGVAGLGVPDTLGLSGASEEVVGKTVEPAVDRPEEGPLEPSEPLFSEGGRKLIVVFALAIIMFGGSIVKPVISGTVAVCSDEAHRARAFSIFYAVVNIGAFSGKSFAAPLRQHLGLVYINFYAALMALCALVLVALLFKNVNTPGQGKTFRTAMEGLVKVVLNFRFMALILIIGGFWAIQHQLYASMPKYIIRMLGETAKPEWLANINPFVVVLLVVPITHMVRNWRPVNSIGMSLLIIPLSSLTISLSPQLRAQFGGSIDLGWFSLHPITFMVIIGIGLQGLAECFLSPKWLEYASKQAPHGEEGLYMGYMHLSSFFAYLFGFIISGYLLDWYCPDPKTLSPEVQSEYYAALQSGAELPAAYSDAHYIWYVYASIGLTAFIALLIYKAVTGSMDRKRPAEAA